jgi:DNA-binding NarL/FixJ family response regulator
MLAHEAQRVVILYAHPLLGEGIGRILRAEPGLEVELVSLDDAGEAARALAADPDVVILERTAQRQALDLLPTAPGALFIDVGLDSGPSWTYRRDAIGAEPNELVRVIHERNEPAAGAPVAAGTPVATAAARARVSLVQDELGRRAPIRVQAVPGRVRPG